MRRHISVLMMYIRSSVYRVIVLLALMVSAQFLLFWQSMKDYSAEYPIGLERIFDRTLLPWTFGLMAVCLTVQLVYVGCNQGVKQSYTLKRLSISEKSVFIWQGICNMGCYLLLWMVQVMTAFALCRWYLALAEPEFVSNQTIFLAFYRSKFLHGLLPLAESSIWVRNLFLVLGLGFASAYFPYLQRRGKFSIGVLLLLVISIIWFPRNVGIASGDFWVILCCAWVIGWIVYKVFIKEDEQDEN